MKVYGGDDNEEAETVVVVATRQRMGAFCDEDGDAGGFYVFYRLYVAILYLLQFQLLVSYLHFCYKKISINKMFINECVSN